jgi:glyoxylase-like metal-dependent hydrolase (beta-lactamase superfamily II)/rhodanese-related sulfurtransferase
VPAVEVVETPELGDRSYLVHDGSVALVVDPQRDTDRLTESLGRLGVELAAVAETHVHNDYLSGGLALSRSADVPYLVAKADAVRFDRLEVVDGDVHQVGSLSVRVVATPGHTPNHVSYVVEDGSAAPAVFTGGSLLFGTVGRTDLISPELARELAAAQYRSVRRLAADLPAEARVFPTHGFGSFCSSGPPASEASSTIGAEQGRNPALRDDDLQHFADELVAGFTAYPDYYVHMAPRNAAGVAPADLSAARRADPEEVLARITAGEWVVDLRQRRLFASNHLTGTLSFELGRPFATYLGWLFRYGEPLTLLGESAEQVAAAQRQLVRIGIDRPECAAVGELDAVAGAAAPHSSYPVVGFSDLPADLTERGDVMLDVRRNDELAAGSVTGAVHVPVAALLESLEDLPDGTLWVHCASGFRAAIAASILQRAGRDVVLIDDEFTKAVALGLTDHG